MAVSAGAQPHRGGQIPEIGKEVEINLTAFWHSFKMLFPFDSTHHGEEWKEGLEAWAQAGSNKLSTTARGLDLFPVPWAATGSALI